MKKYLFWLGLTIYVICFVGNYIYYQSKQLEDPIFLDHYYDIEVYNDNEVRLEFYYLTNKNDDATVKFALINGIEVYPRRDGQFNMWSDNLPEYKQEFTHYYLKSVIFSIPIKSLSNLENSAGIWTFEDMIVFFNNNQEVNANIGAVKINIGQPDTNIFHRRASGGSNQHYDFDLLVVNEPIIIQDIKTSFSKELDDQVKIKVDLDQKKLKQFEIVRQGQDPPQWFEDEGNLEIENKPGAYVSDGLFPFKLAAEDWMQLYIQHNPDHDSYYQINVIIEGMTEAGDEFIYTNGIIDDPYLDQQSINEIIEMKQGGANK
ncbi:hypothetical protein [Cytobacillus sp. IB215316]|uniref:hypothetical protein n=1 Tax=Cytobacillus sp. IB215316 TaxID=3097354 RepID=UPI002A111D49|nr:hypothetical protein [Cytobacillus sp. IB215316]MDX8362539.1 hypothetical protein [Cytobacillus sp. IB215316]